MEIKIEERNKFVPLLTIQPGELFCYDGIISMVLSKEEGEDEDCIKGVSLKDAFNPVKKCFNVENFNKDLPVEQVHVISDMVIRIRGL